MPAPIAVMIPRLLRPGTPKPWHVGQGKTISPTSRKRERWFKSKELATAWIRDEEKRLRSYKDRWKDASDEEKDEAGQAFTIAREHGFSVLTATREKAERVIVQRASKPISIVVSEFVEQLELEKKSGAHITAATYVGKKFQERFANALICDVTTDGLRDWFNDCSKVNKPASVKNFRRYASMILRFAAVEKKYLTSNPLTGLKLRLRDDAAISYLTPEQIETLLRAAAPSIRPYLALCAFAGLRPDEAKELKWRYVGETIYIAKETTKVRAHRRFPTPESLLPWIQDRPGDGVFYSREVWRAAIRSIGYGPKKEGLQKWPQDCLRHSFGSYWLALHDDEAKLAGIMGNSPKTIFTNYRVPVNQAAAAAYFQITP